MDSCTMISMTVHAVHKQTNNFWEMSAHMYMYIYDTHHCHSFIYIPYIYLQWVAEKYRSMYWGRDIWIYIITYPAFNTRARKGNKLQSKLSMMLSIWLVSSFLTFCVDGLVLHGQWDSFTLVQTLYDIHILVWNSPFSKIFLDKHGSNMHVV
jgi:hypothetical protein